MTRVYVSEEHEESTFYVTSAEEGNSYYDRYGWIYDVPDDLVERHRVVMEEFEKVNELLRDFTENHVGERGHLHESLYREQPKFTVYRLTRKDDTATIVELTVPHGASWEWSPSIPIVGTMQWLRREWDEEEFVAHGPEFEYGS